jgi:hypothetical protein
MPKQLALLLLASCLSVSTAFAQAKPDKQTPESTEVWSPEPRVVAPGETGAKNATGSTAPSDATVLFDGKDLMNWVSDKDGTSAAAWNVADGAMTVKPGAGDIRTKQEFEDFQLHIEFRSPVTVKGEGQGRGNSGVFLQGRYEVQVLDSYQNRTYSNGQAGAIYKQSMPLVNASRGPGQWQTYDIMFTAPRFNKDGLMIIPPYVTVLHNGVLIQNHTEVRGTTPYVGLPVVQPHAAGPIKLQDHGDLVSYRNVWIRPL